MHRFAPVALATLLAAAAPPPLCAQAPTPFTVPQPASPAQARFTDPANLAGERVRPRNGRELPIDGGIGANGQPDNALGLAQLLRKLNTRASLMLIVAHPDDEDGGMLAYYSRGLGARVAILTLNRGEGGQNQMTGDFEDALGLLRTQELLSADRYMGIDTQMFGTEVDFGFTKTKAEAFQKWNHQRVLYDAVRAVRIFRPLVIASVFMGAVTDGHGQHQVAGEIAQEVFKAAGDPSVFPELTKEGILPWQPLKVFARVPFSRVTSQGLFDYATGQTVPAEFTDYVTGKTFTTSPTPDVTINEGATDPLLSTCAANPADLPKSFSLSSSREAGSASPSTTATNCQPLSYVQFARIGLGLQRSQIGGGMRVPSPGRSDVSYHLYGSRVCAPNLPNPTPNLCESKSAENLSPPQKASSRPNDLGRHPEPSANGAPGQLAGWGRERAVEGPLYFARTTTTLLSRPEAQSAVAERPAFRTAAFSPSPFTAKAPYNPALTSQPTFFDGIDTSVQSIDDLAPGAFPTDLMSYIARGIRAATEQFDPAHPEKIAPALAASLKVIDELIPDVEKGRADPIAKTNALHELRVKRVQLNDALALALGLRLDATARTQDVVAHTPLTVATTITSNWPGKLYNQSQMLMTSDQRTSPGFIIADNNPGFTSAAPFDRTLNIHGETLAEVTRPYFSRTDIEQPIYALNDAALRNAPSPPPALTVWARIVYSATPIELARVVHSGSQPVQIIPPVSLTLDRHAEVLPNGTHSLKIDVHTQTEDHPEGELRLHAPSAWTIRSPERPLRAGTETFAASLPAHPQTSSLKAEASISGTTYTEGFRPIGYGTLPRTNFYTPATLRVVPVDLKLPPPNKRRIAYLPGTGDDVPAALASIGLTPTLLKVSDLTAANLSKFDTVVLGVRTYNAHPDLHGAPTQALLDFARNGGNVVVQYQTPEFTAADAPYPLTTHNERVIDESAPVQILDASSPLLTTPNNITPADFNGWIEERGHGFLDTWDPHYTALTEVHDPGAPAEHIEPQAPQRGGLVTVQLGKGHWTYVAFALYRQLPEAVPGAFRLFVNLLNP